MAIDAFAARLGNIEIFRGLSQQQLSMISRAADRIVFRAGQRIITAGAAGDAAYLMMGGEARAFEADEIAGSGMLVPEGSLVGEMAMLIEHDYAVTVIASSAVRAIRLSRETMHRLMVEDPSLAQHFTERIASRLTRMAVELRRIDQMLALATEGPAHHA